MLHKEQKIDYGIFSNLFPKVPKTNYTPSNPYYSRPLKTDTEQRQQNVQNFYNDNGSISEY